MIKHIKDAFLYNKDGIRFVCDCGNCGNTFETTDSEKQYECPSCGNFLKLSTSERKAYKKCSCGKEVVLTDSDNSGTIKCKDCGIVYDSFGGLIEDYQATDSFEEVSKAVEHKGGPLKHKKLNMPTEAAKKLGQALNGIVATDSREYIGEYNEVYYERYRGITIYKKKISEYEFEYVAEFLEKEYKSKTANELREKLDEAVTKYVEKYAKDFSVKK